MTRLLLIGAGGATGAILRYLLTGVSNRFLGDDFPWGTLIVNMTGCLLIGFLWAATERTPFSQATSLFLFTGVIGAFTTFSTYGLESFVLLRDGQLAAGLLNVAISNLGGVALVLAGYLVARFLLSTGGGAAVS